MSGDGGRAMPASGWGFESALSRHSSLLKRIRENFESVWKLPRVALAANSAPIHLLDVRSEKATIGAQASSTFVHALIVALVIYLMAHHLDKPRTVTAAEAVPVASMKFATPKWLRDAANDSLGKKGGGGELNPLPPTAGELAPHSPVVLAPPRLPDGRPHPLPIQVTTFDADAPELTQPVKDLGLPWMTDPNNSAGSGRNGIGTVPGHRMGNDSGDGVGEGDDSRAYAHAATQVVCRICPDPLYSDEARKQKLQGRVTMRVLVGADGRPRDVQVTHGLGLGLDENAANAVRTWQFIPAKDAARRPVASWITIETLFRLY
jgi:protein TonB